MDGVHRVGTEFYGTHCSSSKPFTSLEILTFDGMLEWEFPHLQELYIWKCPKLHGQLPNHLPSLTKLEIDGCQQLVASLPIVPAIHELKIRNCAEVGLRIPASSFAHLESLEVSDISQWTELPRGLQRLSVERYLVLRECSFSRSLCSCGLPATLKSLGTLASLDLLSIIGCPDLVSVELPAMDLARCVILNCKNLKFLRHTLSSFQSLLIQNCPELLFPTEGWPRNLNSLEIENCDKLSPRVESQVFQVSSLWTVTHFNSFLLLQNYPSLIALNSNRDSCLLSFLQIKNCPLLTSSCLLKKGEDGCLVGCPSINSAHFHAFKKALAFWRVDCSAGPNSCPAQVQPYEAGLFVYSLILASLVTVGSNRCEVECHFKVREPLQEKSEIMTLLSVKKVKDGFLKCHLRLSLNVTINNDTPKKRHLLLMLLMAL
ncbi:hypothetical protein AAG906_007439 [Vitis piasezkii]